MKLLCREVAPDEVEQEMTQRDQFNTDEVGLEETLIRESHQNSLDARGSGAVGVVRTRFAVVEAGAQHAGYWKALFAALEPHLAACGMDTAQIDFARPRILVIEDFGTTGLTGAWDGKDGGNFSDFWRRFGRSHKKGSQGGRWGLGKLVFSSYSGIRTFFGLTIRHDDPERMPLLMGQAVLTNHRVGTTDFAPHAFFAMEGEKGFQLPAMDAGVIGPFCNAAGVTRTTEPGLSVVIPFIRGEFRITDLIPMVVRNYFFPVLTGQLEVEIGDEKISAETFDGLATKYGGATLADGSLIRFIRELEFARKRDPMVTLAPDWSKDMERGLDEKALKSLREAYGERKLIHVRAPIVLARKNSSRGTSHFDLFLRVADDGLRGHALFIRGAITLPGEAQFFHAGQVFGALVASDGLITDFLGDAENPAHTRWNGNAEKLAAHWQNPSARLREVRSSLNSLNTLLARAVEKFDQDALIHLLAIKDESAAPKPKDIVRPSPFPPITPRPRSHDIVPRANGFAIKGNVGASADHFPIQIRVRAAYDLMRGDPFRKHSPYDFDFTKDELDVTAMNAEFTRVSANELLIEAESPAFIVEVRGFDANRDVLVRTTVQS